MTYSEPLINQITVFFFSVGMGVLLGVVYDLIMLIRMCIGESRRVYIFFDISFFILAALLSFFFMVLFNTGRVRLNLIAGEAAGGVAFHLSLGRSILSLFRKRLVLLRHRLRKALTPLKKISCGIRERLSLLLLKLKGRAEKGKNSEKSEKKFINIRKILLKNKNKSV